MDAVLSNLRAIACPEGDNCTRPSCPLQHNRDKRPPITGLDGIDEKEPSGEGPRKRRKMSSEPQQANQPNTLVSTAKKPISPPPIKRDLKAPTHATSISSSASPTPSRFTPRTATPSVKFIPGHECTPTRNEPSGKPLEPKVPAHATPISSSASPTPSHYTPRTATPSLKFIPRHEFTPTRSESGGKPLDPTSTSTPAATKSTSVSTPVKAAPPRKPESLNPRHLRSTAPAPHDFRYKALKLLHDQFAHLNNELKKDAKDDDKKLLLSPQELIWMALDEEEKMATEKPSIYQNIIKNRIMTYKRMKPGQWRDERLAEVKKQEAAAAPKRAAPRLPPGQPREINTGLTPQQEVAMLYHLLTPITELSKYNYVPTMPTDEAIAKAREGEQASDGWEQCDRCTSRFQVFPGRREEDGALTSGGKCIYHWGKPYFPERAASNSIVKKKYKCCGESVGLTSGCTTGDSHVFKAGAPARLASLIPFVETPPNPSVPKDRAVCFDCEMGYTVHGLELLRLTATSWPDGKELLDVLVYPVGEIIDLNSRYSGVWPEDLVNAIPWTEEFKPDLEETPPTPPTTTPTSQPQPTPPKKKPLPIVSSPTVARDLLFRLIAPETPLIGHGLENDLNALRVIHPTIVDTVLLYPHNRGLPIRYGLKALMKTHLGKDIQVDGEVGADGRVAGHDSGEDARAAGELVRYKVEVRWREMVRMGWRVGEGGELVPPGGEGGGKVMEGVEEITKSAGGVGVGVGVGGLLTERFLEEGFTK